MDLIIHPAPGELESLTRRNIPSDDPAVARRVAEIVEAVRTGGDAALRRLALEIDGVELTDLCVSEEEIAEGCSKVKGHVGTAIRRAAANIRAFHEAQRPADMMVETVDGVRCEQRAVPIERVGLYVPGGRAPLFSTVLMLGIPARLAGCREVVMFTPQAKGHPIAPEILYAAREAGIDRIYRVGGAQAVAAMAYGTESIGRVHKIFGPGNRYVTKAKQMVSDVTAIDMPAGPSEVMVMADHTANASFVAADMLSQAEHGPDSQAIAVTDSEEMGRAIVAETKRMAATLPRRDSVAGSLAHSRVVVVESREEMVAFSNLYAPEHLILSVERPWDAAADIRAAGSVFIGNYSPESAGDYASGTNHTLPTGGWARSMSGVSLESFMHRITFQELTPAGLGAIAPVITAMARAEGLEAHARAAEVRFG